MPLIPEYQILSASMSPPDFVAGDVIVRNDELQHHGEDRDLRPDMHVAGRVFRATSIHRMHGGRYRVLVSSDDGAVQNRNFYAARWIRDPGAPGRKVLGSNTKHRIGVPKNKLP